MPSNLKKRKSRKKTSNTKKIQSGGATSSSSSGQPFVKTINKRLEYTNNSYLQSQIEKNIKESLSKVEELHKKVEELHKKGGVITDPSINQMATTEKNIKEVGNIINDLSEIINILPQVNKMLREMLKDGKNYVDEKKKAGISNHNDFVSIHFYKNWSNKKKNRGRRSATSRRTKKSTTSLVRNKKAQPK